MNIDNDILSLRFEDGILKGKYKKKGLMTLQDARVVVESRLELIGDQVVPAMIGAVIGTSFTKEARDYLSSDEGIKGLKAAAIVADSVVISTIANFFLKVTVQKPKIPTRIFKNEAKALEWLRTFL